MTQKAIGTRVRLIAHSGEYEIIASKYDPQTGADDLSLPNGSADYSFKRIDGVMERSFEPYLHLPGTFIEEEI